MTGRGGRTGTLGEAKLSRQPKPGPVPALADGQVPRAVYCSMPPSEGWWDLTFPMLGEPGHVSQGQVHPEGSSVSS